MSRSFANTTDDISAGTRALPTSAGSLMCWWYPTFSQSDGQAHCVFDCRNDSSNVFNVVKYSNNFFYAGWFTAGIEHRVVTNSFTLNQNAWNSVVVTWDDSANQTKLYLNGSQAGSTTSTLVTFTSTGTRWIGNQNGGTTLSAGGRLAEFAIIDRVLSSSEVTAFHLGRLPNEFGRLDQYLPLWGNDSPEPDLSGNNNGGTVTGAVKANHAPTVPHSLRLWRARATAAALNAYTLSADSGSFSLSGQAAGLKASRVISAANGAFSLSGQATSLLASRKLAAGAGSFALAGQSAGLRATRTLAAASGVYALAGQAAGLPAARRLPCDAGGYSLAGQATGLLSARRIAAGAGSFALAGQDSSLRAARTVSAAAGSYSLTGNAAGLLAARKLTADAGGYSLAGEPASLLAGRRCVAATGSFDLSGQVAALRAYRRLSAGPGAYALAGQDADLSYAPDQSNAFLSGGVKTRARLAAGIRIYPRSEAAMRSLGLLKGGITIRPRLDADISIRPRTEGGMDP